MQYDLLRPFFFIAQYARAIWRMIDRVFSEGLTSSGV